MADLAATVFLSERQFTRLFRAVYRQSPLERLIRLRIELACRLIRTTGLSLTDVALRSGFGDKVSFSRQFRNVLGITPGQYRRLERGKADGSGGN